MVINTIIFVKITDFSSRGSWLNGRMGLRAIHKESPDDAF